MFAWIKKFLTDETAFVRISRAVLMGLGGLAVAGELPSNWPDWMGAPLMAVGMLMGAGDKNPKTPGDEALGEQES